MKKNWYRKACDGCKEYCQECRQGVCSVYPYKSKKSVTNGEKIDTS